MDLRAVLALAASGGCFGVSWKPSNQRIVVSMSGETLGR